MKSVFLHGLGQSASSWDKTLENSGGFRAVCPELSKLMTGEASYSALYNGFSEYCEKLGERINLCGLSLGGILALNYAAEHLENVNSLVLIGAQYKMPKALLRFQNLIFRFMPNSAFKDVGLEKADFIRLSKSMMDLDFGEELEKIACPVLVIVGERDKPNRKAAEELSKKLPNSEFEVIADSGHEVNVDAPKRLAELIGAFWEVH